MSLKRLIFVNYGEKISQILSILHLFHIQTIDIQSIDH